MNELQELNFKQKLALFALTFGSNVTIFIMGFVLNCLPYLAVIFFTFVIINSYLIAVDKKIHAPKLWKIPDLIMCYISTNGMFLVVMLVVKYVRSGLSAFETLFVGVVLIAFASVILSGIFYWKPEGATRYHRFRDYVKLNYAGQREINDDLKQFESFLKQHKDKRRLVIYKNIFIHGEKPSFLAEMLDIETSVINHICKELVIDFYMDYYAH